MTCECEKARVMFQFIKPDLLSFQLKKGSIPVRNSLNTSEANTVE